MIDGIARQFRMLMQFSWCRRSGRRWSSIAGLFRCRVLLGRDSEQAGHEREDGRDPILAQGTCQEPQEIVLHRAGRPYRDTPPGTSHSRS